MKRLGMAVAALGSAALMAGGLYLGGCSSSSSTPSGPSDGNNIHGTLLRAAGARNAARAAAGEVPVAGAVITVDGAAAAVTDAKGAFAVNVTPAPHVLGVEGLPAAKVAVDPAGLKDVNLTLNVDAKGTMTATQDVNHDGTVNAADDSNHDGTVETNDVPGHDSTNDTSGKDNQGGGSGGGSGKDTSGGGGTSGGGETSGGGSHT